MKRVIAFLAVLLVAVGMVAAADPVEGFWKSIDDETGKVTGFWRIYETGGELRGEMVKVPGQSDLTLASAVESSYPGHPSNKDLSKEPVIGTPWIWGLSRRRSGEWQGGSIVDPGSGSKYTCTITFHSAGSKVKTGVFSSKTVSVDTLEMRGSIGPIGKSQYWERANESEIPN